MADVRDPFAEAKRYPVTVLRRIHSAAEPAIGEGSMFPLEGAAIAELERRARVERRLEAWLKEETTGLPRAAHHQLDVAGNHVVSLQIAAEDAAFDRRADYWTAADAALTAAGAPKEEG